MTAAQWTTPIPLWREPTIRQSGTAFRQPALLRFATDRFMDELASVLGSQPAALAGLVAQPETWAKPRVGVGTVPSGDSMPLKLYQPAHQRYYLIATSLVCRTPGFPDHTINSSAEERVSFVIRRVVAPQGGDARSISGRTEFAWVPGEPGRWVALSNPLPLPDEEQMGMFPLATREGDLPRRLLGGFVPVAKREIFAGGRNPTANTSVTVPDDPRLIEFQRRVVDPWAELLNWYDRLAPAQRSTPQTAAAVYQASALILLDFANVLAEVAPTLATAIQNETVPAAGPARDLFMALGNLRAVLRAVKAKEAALEAATLGAQPAAIPNVSLTSATFRALIDRRSDGSRPIVTAVQAALPPMAPQPAPSMPVRRPATSRVPDWYVIRCVYTRPHCLPFIPPLVSDPTPAFQLASFFDSDAPARPTTVVLPLDTTPAGLRKADKGVAFLISEELSKQLNRIKGIKELGEGDLGPAVGLGMICSMSIPIVTLCAFVVLMIFISLLNIVFWWMPFFKICFPVPQLGAKE
jgi:hypothetical protein